MMTNRKIPDKVRSGIALPMIRVNFEDYNLEEMTQDDLVALKIQIDSERDTISFQLGEAAANLHLGGEHADPKWYNRAKFAARIKTQQSQAVQAYLGKLNRKNKPLLQLDSFFMDTAREMLSTAVFDAIMEEAKTRRDEEVIRRIAQGIPVADRSTLGDDKPK